MATIIRAYVLVLDDDVEGSEAEINALLGDAAFSQGSRVYDFQVETAGSIALDEDYREGDLTKHVSEAVSWSNPLLAPRTLQ